MKEITDDIFDAKIAFGYLDNRIFADLKEIRKAIDRVYIDNMRTLPADIGSEDLLHWLLKRGWVKKVNTAYVLKVGE